MTHYLGIDIGTTGIKTILIDEVGSLVCEANATYPLEQPQPGWTQHGPDDWWNATVAPVRKATIEVASHTATDRKAAKVYESLLPIYRRWDGGLKDIFTDLVSQ